MSSTGGTILTALKERLDRIKTANGYTTNVKIVRLDFSKPTMNAPERDLPLIEIINESEKYEHGNGAYFKAFQDVVLWMVAPKDWTDSKMEQFKSDICKCIYGNAPDASGNSGLPIGPINGVYLIDAVADLNMIQSNRLYLMKIRLESHRKTYQG